MDSNVLWILAIVCAAFAVGGLVAWQNSGNSVFRSVLIVSPFRVNGGTIDGKEDYSKELVTLRNPGKSPVDLSAWTLSNDRNDVFTFPAGFSIPGGADVTIHSGCGENSQTDLYWCSSGPVWDDSKDEALLQTADAKIVDMYTYDLNPCPSCGLKH